MAKFVPRQRKHKVLARERAKQDARFEVEDTNQEVLPARNQQLKDEKAKLRAELKEEGVKVSGKKAKRLEKYIDSKLRKDENRELLAKLAQRKIDTSLFTSSKSLGQGHETKRQALRRAFREQQAGIASEASQGGLLYERRSDGQEDSDIDDEAEDGESTEKPHFAFQNSSQPTSEKVQAEDKGSPENGPNLGSGLKRPLELDDDGRPVIRKRKKRGGVKSRVPIKPPEPQSESEAEFEEWNGLDSEDGDATQSDGNDSGRGQIDKVGANEGPENGSFTGSDSGSEEESEGDSEDEPSGDDGSSTERMSGFKAWANLQRNMAAGYEPAGNTPIASSLPRPANFTPRAPEHDPLPTELKPTINNTSRKAFVVPVTRSPAVQDARLKLPVVAEEQRIMEAIHNHNVVVVCGATGSGKTTQVPQFLFEAGYGFADSPTPGMLGITQPRRVAAVSMSKRVAEELGDRSESVAYQIRFEHTVDNKTAIKFMTDGVLLREIAQDFPLRKYSAIIIDEAHERSINTDILIGILSRIIKLRSELAEEDPKIRPLKLIIMSATLRIEDLTMNPRLFATPPPVLEVGGRQYPVTVHFSRRTTHDYVEEAFKKISRGHRKLPPGGFLVFLTGRNEILQLSKRLKSAFGGPQTADELRVQISANEAPMEVEDIEFGDFHDHADDENIDDDMLLDEEEKNDAHEFDIGEEEQDAPPLKVQILPLYSLLPTREQLRVFQPPSDGTRQIILATNVAETSLTIPGTRFVFDCGRSKQRQYDRLSGVQSYDIGWISKASADQRSGRAGRTGPGHCYRLYSSAVYERDFPQFADPEILRMPIEGVVLQLKAMNLQHVVNFPFPTPPESTSLEKAEKLLAYLSALSSSGQVTDIGSTMAVFPLSPRYARILLVGHLHDCLPYAIAMVAGLSAAEVFLPENEAIPALAAKHNTAIRTTSDVQAEDHQANVRRMFNEVHKNFCFLDDKADGIKLLQVVGEFAHEPTEEWCETHFVRFRVLKEIQQLRRQLTEILRTNIPNFAGLKYQDKLDAPTAKQVSALKQMLSIGFIDQVAIRADLSPQPPEQHRTPRRAIDVPYIPLIPLTLSNESENDRHVYIHPTSPMAHLSTQECPKYIVYAYLQRATPSGQDPAKKAKTRMHSLTDVAGNQLAELAKQTPLISYGKPIKEVKRPSLLSGSTTRECWVVPYLRAENIGGQGWPLPVKKVKQRKVPGKGWVVE